ncbi:MAG TPA: cytochrome oxidase subunit III [Cytophagales bacterium]|nr:cytochrome oxidase subunit III [Cytophagales bacterium]HAA17879.1 cytochrome oxidase subunit III [Cytophagales bacterium]HAP58198.1 cytochrome oxidase subunit III [Cytophagales bacterium]
MATTAAHAPAQGNTWSGGKSPMKASYGKLMMWFFLLSDAFTFSGLLVAYGLIRSAWPAFAGAADEFVFSLNHWPVPEEVFKSFPGMEALGIEKAPLVFVGIMTFILIMSSVTMVLAVEAGHRMDQKDTQRWMLWTIIGGLTFLGCQAWEWSHFIHGEHGAGATSAHMNPDGTIAFFGANLTLNQYGPPAFADLFFFITGFHGFHVFSGVLLNFIIFYNVVVGTYQRRGHYEMVEKVGLYWHFVDLVWVFVFTFFYLI